MRAVVRQYIGFLKMAAFGVGLSNIVSPQIIYICLFTKDFNLSQQIKFVLFRLMLKLV